MINIKWMNEFNTIKRKDNFVGQKYSSSKVCTFKMMTKVRKEQVVLGNYDIDWPPCLRFS